MKFSHRTRHLILCFKAFDLKYAIGLTDRLNLHGNPGRRKQSFNPLGPFHHYDATLFEQLGKADRIKIIGSRDAVRVQMINRQPPATIDVQKNKRRAAYGPARPAQPANQPADELRLSGTEITIQCNALAALEIARERGGNVLGLLNAVRSVDQD